MKIVFQASVDDNACRQVIEEAATILSVPDDAVEQVIVAKDYVAAVESIDSSASVTETDDSESVGKTLTKKTNGIVCSSVVYRAERIAEIGRARQTRIDTTSWPRYDQLSPYAVFHELGHCIDYYKRQVMQAPHRLLLSSQEEVGEYCWPILLEEFAATCHAALAATLPMYESVASNSKARISDGIENYKSNLGKWRTGCLSENGIWTSHRQTAWYLSRWLRVLACALPIRSYNRFHQLMGCKNRAP